MARGGELIREARLRAGLTQSELAELMGTSQSVIARWERGHRSPTVETLVEAVRACGLDLAMSVVTRDVDHDLLIARNLKRTPAERLESMTLDREGLSDLLASITKV